MKKYLISGYDYSQDVLLEPGTYTIVVTVKSMFGDTYSFSLWNGTEWEVFDIGTVKDEWKKIYLTFTITDSKTKFNPIARYFDEAHKVFIHKPQIVKGNIPSEPGSSPFDIDQIVDDLHDGIDSIADFTNEEFADRVLSASEKVSLKRDLEVVETIFQSLKGSFEKLLINPFISATAMSDLQAKYAAVVSAKSLLFTVIDGIIAGDDIVTDSEILAKDNALSQLNIALYNYNQAEKEIYNDLGEDYTQQIAEIRDFTDEEFVDRVLSEQEKISLGHDLDTVQLMVDSITAGYNVTLDSPYLSAENKLSLQVKYNKLMDAWELSDDPVKPDGLKTVILDIINDDEIITPDEIAEKNLALSAFNTALSEYSTLETSLKKVAIDNSIIASSSWELHTSSPVIYKDAPDAATDGVHTPITVTGRHWVGGVMTEEGFITVTANSDVEPATASPSPVTIAPFNNADKHTYTIRLYSDANKTELLDYETIPVVFKGAKGLSAIRLHIDNPVDVLPADSAGNVLSFTGTGTVIHVFEGATELDYDGIGEANGSFKVTAVPTNITMGAITDSGNVCVVADATAMAAYKASIVYTVTGKTLYGFDFTVSGEQNFTKTKMGKDAVAPIVINGHWAFWDETIQDYVESAFSAIGDDGHSPYVDGNTGTWWEWNDANGAYQDTGLTAEGKDGTGILDVIDYYGVSMSASVLPTAWQTTVPAKGANEYLWNYEKILYTDGTFTETEKRVIQGKDGRGIISIVNAYGYSTDHTTPPSIWYYLAQLPEKQPGQVLWVREDITYTDGTSNATIGYPVRDGEKGETGDGILDVADWYAISTSGTTAPSTGWQTTLPTKPANYYLWNYEAITYTDGRTPTQTQKRVIQGKDARSIYDIKNAYAYSASDTVSPTSGWQYSIAALGAKPAGYFLWVREDIAYTDNPSNYIGTIGYVVKDGSPGEDGDGITGTTIEYAKSSSGTTPPSSGWSTNLPSPTLGWYLWTRTTTTYKKSSATVAYSISRWPADGGTGKGVSSVVIWYYKSSSATTQTGGSWSTTKPDYSASFFLWTKVITTYTDNSTTETTPILDPDWHKVMAITDKFGVTTEGALIQAVMMLLREANTLDVTAGISGIQGSLRNNPSYWSGGTYAQAYALIQFLSKMSAGTSPAAGEYDALAKITLLHNGAAKLGDFIIEPSGRIIMVDPATGNARLIFGVENIPTVASLMAGTVYSGSTAIGGGMTSTSLTLSGSTYVSHAGAIASFNGTTISISAYGTADPGGISGFAEAKLYAYRDGVRSLLLASAMIYFTSPFGNPSYQSDSNSVPASVSMLGAAGIYTFRLEIEKTVTVSSVSASNTASSLSWTYTLQGVRRQQYGLDGMMFFYSDSHFHFTEGEGLDGRAPVNKWNAPGVLLSGTVASAGSWTSVWGHKTSASPPVNNSTGRYTVYHSVGHTNYQVSAVANTASKTCHIVSKSATNFVIEWRTVSSSPALGNTGFDFQIIGNNYA